jgi:hypothetical protein
MKEGPASRRKPRRRATRRSGLTSAAVILLVIAAIALNAHQEKQRARDAPLPLTVHSDVETPAAPAAFRCDGRTQCSQMTSCQEAKYFIQNCPGTTMDGDNDGVPCERQWCDRHR